MNPHQGSTMNLSLQHLDTLICNLQYSKTQCAQVKTKSFLIVSSDDMLQCTDHNDQVHPILSLYFFTIIGQGAADLLEVPF